MSNERNGDGNTNGLESTPSCVRKVGAKQRNDIDPRGSEMMGMMITERK